MNAVAVDTCPHDDDPLLCPPCTVGPPRHGRADPRPFAYVESRPIKARGGGTCKPCEHPIKPGQAIKLTEEFGWVHSRCVIRRPDEVEVCIGCGGRRVVHIDCATRGEA